MKTIGEFVAALSPAERERHKKLIEECREREKQFEEAGAENEKIQKELENSVKAFCGEVRKLAENVAALAKAEKELLEKAGEARLRALPDKDFAFS